MKKYLSFPFLLLLVGFSACKKTNNNGAPSSGTWGDLRVQVRSMYSSPGFKMKQHLPVFIPPKTNTGALIL